MWRKFHSLLASNPLKLPGSSFVAGLEEHCGGWIVSDEFNGLAFLSPLHPSR